LIGLYDTRETDIENIFDARERYYKQYAPQERPVETMVMKEDRMKLMEENDN